MSQKIINKIIGPLGIFSLSLVITLLWFRQGLMYAGGEDSLPFYNLTKHLVLISHAWYDAGTGFRLVGLLPRIPYFSALEFLFRHGVDGVILQAFTFWILILIGCLSVFYLVKETVGNELKGESKTIVPLLAGVFYLLNPFSMTQVWGRGIYAQFFAFALFPAFLLLFILGLTRKNLLYGLFAIFLSLFLSGVYAFPGHALTLWFLVFLYSGFYFITYCHNKKDRYFTIIFFLITFVGWVFTNMFWILPPLVTFSQQFSVFGNTESNLASLQGVSRQFPLPILIRLMQTGYFYGDLYGEIYSTPIFALISLIIPAVSFFSIPRFKQLKHFKFYVFIFLIALFINLGSNFPLGWLFEFIFRNVPYLQIFRNPYEKLGLVLLLAYAPFFSIGLFEFPQKFSRRFHSVRVGWGFMILLIMMTSVVYVWPMWTGVFAGGFKINPWVRVPEYYREADEWLKSQTTTLRTIQFPLNPGEGVRFYWQHPYRGVEPSDLLFTNPSIRRNAGFNKIYYNVLLERFGIFQPNIYGPDPDISRSEFRGENLYQELEKLGVGYIVLHRDVDTSLSGMKSVEETIAYLSKEKNIKRVKTFGELDIYKADLSKDVDIIYSPDAPTTFSKVNPTLYEVRVKNAKGPINLYFLELFDNGWEAYIDGRKINNRYKIFSYANAWKINKSGSLDILIKYKPQDMVEKGRKITFYSALLLTSVIFILITRKRLSRT